MMQAATEQSPTLQDVRTAAGRLRDVVRMTPLQRAEALGASFGADVRLKLECWQRTGSFKLRGAYNAIASLSEAERARGVVTASAGNHGQAVALAAREHGVRAIIFVPRTAPRVKQERIRSLGADLRVAGADYDEAEALAQQYAVAEGSCLVHAFSDPAVVAGQGTLALEILEQAPDVATVIVPVGGGGLLAGIGLVLAEIAPQVAVIGVQSTQTRAMHEALRAGRLVDVPVPPTLADGLAGCTDEASVRRVREIVDDVILVEEADIAAAIRMLFATEGVVAEGAGAVAVAAVLAQRVPLRGLSVLLVSGGNIDASVLAGILGQGH
jgi:threonine dehydratase